MRVDALDDEHLIIGLIGKAARAKVADRTLESLLALSTNELTKTGLSAACAKRLAIASEIARRHQPECPSPRVVTRPRDVVAICQAIRDASVETLAVLALDAGGRLLGQELVAEGPVFHVAVSPGEVFRTAIVARANSIVLAHNHPSGNVRPSPEDLAFTRRMVGAAELLGVHVIDHVIVARRAFFSFWEGGMIRSPEPSFWKAL